MVDLSSTITPKSDQLNSEDFLLGARTFTVEKVTSGSAEQPINIHLVESPGKPWRPSKSMRRILVATWGVDGDLYPGRRLTLYRDPNVRYGGDEVGGIKVSHLSGLTKPVKIALTVTRGKRQAHVVEPLREASPTLPTAPPEALSDAVIEGVATVGELRELWPRASKAQQERIRERVSELEALEVVEHDNAND